MEATIHEQLIKVLCFNTPKGKKTVDTLISIIPISKEAAYRRLRGEIRFSLDEAVRIFDKYKVSLDEIAGIDKNYQHIFHIRHMLNDNFFDNYYNLLGDVLGVYAKLKNVPDSMLYIAGNIPSTAFYFRYKLIAKFVLYRYYYQTVCLQGFSQKMQDMVILPKITAIQQKIFLESAHVNTCFIWGSEMVSTLVGDINYFASIGLITSGEVEELKKEILISLNDMETMTKSTVHPQTDKKREVYVSNLYIDGNYSYVKGIDCDISTIGLYGINQLDSIDPVICEMQKDWIDSLIQDSTLISGSGKIHAIDFFYQQRAYLNHM